VEVVLAVVVETAAEAITATAVLLVRQTDKMAEPLFRLFPERQQVLVAEIVAVAGTAVETAAGIEAVEQALPHRRQQPMQPQMTAAMMLQARLPVLPAIAAAGSPL
jgi:hypothetical protein